MKNFSKQKAYTYIPHILLNYKLPVSEQRFQLLVPVDKHPFGGCPCSQCQLSQRALLTKISFSTWAAYEVFTNMAIGLHLSESWLFLPAVASPTAYWCRGVAALENLPSQLWLSDFLRTLTCKRTPQTTHTNRQQRESRLLSYFPRMDSCTLKLFYLVFRKNGLLKKYILSHYMNTDK